MREVVKINPVTFEYEGKYESMTSAAKDNHTTIQQIHNVCNLYLNVCKTAGNYIFMYKEAYDSKDKEEIKKLYTRKSNNIK